jgi:hypothetical protein
VFVEPTSLKRGEGLVSGVGCGWGRIAVARANVVVEERREDEPKSTVMRLMWS